MTKEEFSNFYNVFTSLIKQEVNGHYSMGASCRLIDFCGGCELELHPSCLMWGSELALLSSLCDRFAVSMEVTLYNGKIIIR